MDIKNIFLILSVILVFFGVGNLLSVAFNLDKDIVHKRRKAQLDKLNQEEDASMSEIIDKLSKPISERLFINFKPKNLAQIEKDLRMSGWNKYFNDGIQFLSVSLLLKLAGVLAFLVLFKFSMPIAIVWALVLILGIDVLFRNSAKNRRQALMAEFPDFIRMTEGYLQAGIPLSEAVGETIKFMGEAWTGILRNFVIQCDTKSVSEALEFLKVEIDLFEVREFVALVNLSLEQGGDISESFTAQADKVKEIQVDLMRKKIEGRKVMGMAIQGPLLLCNFVAFGLPIVEGMMNLGG